MPKPHNRASLPYSLSAQLPNHTLTHTHTHTPIHLHTHTHPHTHTHTQKHTHTHTHIHARACTALRRRGLVCPGLGFRGLRSWYVLFSNELSCSSPSEPGFVHQCNETQLRLATRVELGYTTSQSASPHKPDSHMLLLRQVSIVLGITV